MKIVLWVIIAIIVIAVIVLIVVLRGNSYRSGTGSAPAVSNQSASVNEVKIANLSFSPSSIKVKVGDTVTWINDDSTQHTVISTTFDSGILNPGTSFNFTFSQAGTFDYHCSIHPQMTGKIIVE